MRAASLPRTPGRRATGDSGFTMVEVIVSITLMGFIMVALTPVFWSSMRTAASTNSRTGAAGIATRDVEAMRAFPYTSIGFYQDQPGFDPSPFEGMAKVRLGPTAPAGTFLTPTGTANLGGHRFSMQRHIVWADANAAQTEAYKKTVVFVSWTDETGTHRVRQESMVYPGGRGAYTGPKNNSGDAATPAPSTPPNPPTLNTAAVAAPPSDVRQVDLTWTPGAGGGTVSHFVMEWATDAAFAIGSQMSAPIPSTATSHSVTTLSSGTTYYFRLIAYEAGGAASSPSGTLSATTAGAPPGPCTVTSLGMTTDPGGSTTKTYLSKNSPANGMTDDLIFTISTSGFCVGGYTVRGTDPAGLASPESPWAAGGSGPYSVKTATIGDMGWAKGLHTFRVWDSAGQVSPPVVHTLLVCAYDKPQDRSPAGNAC